MPDYSHGFQHMPGNSLRICTLFLSSVSVLYCILLQEDCTTVMCSSLMCNWVVEESTWVLHVVNMAHFLSPTVGLSLGGENSQGDWSAWISQVMTRTVCTRLNTLMRQRPESSKAQSKSSDAKIYMKSRLWTWRHRRAEYVKKRIICADTFAYFSAGLDICILPPRCYEWATVQC